MTNYSPENFQKELRELFCKTGVALVIVPHLPRTYAHGAAFWLGEKAVIMNTIRGKWADIFWFSLFHEIGHILLHSKQKIFIESDKKELVAEKLEDEANEVASKKLIDQKSYQKFVNQNSFFKEDILYFAKNQNIHPGIVVGRLQHDKFIEPSWHNDLREQFSWT